MPESANEHLDVLEAMLRANPPSAILDVGMGRGNYGWFLRNKVGYKGLLYGLEVWAPYVVGDDALAGGNRNYYDKIIVADVRQSFDVIRHLLPDVIFAFDVIEHMERHEGVAVLRALQYAALRNVLVSLPIVPYPQGPIHGNPHEEHKYDWSPSEMIGLGSELKHRGQVTGLFEFPGGGVDKLVTVMLNTVREDSATAGRHALRSIADDLRHQTLKQMELIIVDGLHEHRAETFAEHDYPFRILHVPPKDTSAMVRDRRCAISAYKNTAIAHARGQLLVTLDDCCTFGPNFIETYWNAWARDHLLLQGFYHGDTSNDSRAVYLDTSGKCVGPMNGDFQSPPMYGFAGIALEAALKVNGYDEMYDGSRGLEDVDMGIRLQKAGYRLALDRKHTFQLFPQGPWSSKVFGRQVARGEANLDTASEEDTTVKCSQTTLQLQLAANRPRANEAGWSPEQWAKVSPRCFKLGLDLGQPSPEGVRCSLNGHPCPYVGSCSDREHPGLASLRENPPVFDLTNLRRANGIR